MNLQSCRVGGYYISLLANNYGVYDTIKSAVMLLLPIANEFI